MISVNQNYLKLQKSYLFTDIAHKVAAYKNEHPEARVISLGIGDVTRPLAPAVISALQKAVAEMGTRKASTATVPSTATSFSERPWPESTRPSA